jgi:ABC-type branched-subunit amino acid transport system ATPase component
MTDLLECRGVTKHFGGVRAVTDVSFTVRQGGVTAVIGPNGAGKTTMLNLMTGLVRPDRGTITMADSPIVVGRPWRNVGAGMARTLQTPVVFPDLTVLQNVMLGHIGRRRLSFVGAMVRTPAVRRWAREAEQEARGLLESMGLAALGSRRATELSLGQQRLVELARALATGPRLLLLDEPASGLAHAEVDRLGQLLQDAVDRDITVCLVEHNMRMVMSLSDHVVVLDHGEVLTSGTPAEVRANQDVVAAYLGRRG